MQEAEQRGIPFMFKLRMTKNVKKLVERTFMKGGWTDAGHGFQGKEEKLARRCCEWVVARVLPGRTEVVPVV